MYVCDSISFPSEMSIAREVRTYVHMYVAIKVMSYVMLQYNIRIAIRIIVGCSSFCSLC